MQASPFEALFARLAQSNFRSRFRLGPEEVACIERRGMAVIRRHAEGFVRRRLAPAFIPNDGRQTPMRGHPVFIAQHATACCCRFFRRFRSGGCEGTCRTCVPARWRK